MTNAQHTFTPGPWFWKPARTMRHLTSATKGGMGISIESPVPEDHPCVEANARLIAAAPDYDEAAKLVRDSAAAMKADEYGTWVSGVIISGEAYNAIMDAIAKATQA